MASITLITGGARSGKSRFALEKALGYAGTRAFIATAVAIDGEMRERIEKHREERAGFFKTIEEPYDLASALRHLPEGTRVACIDCLTVWLGNLMHRYADDRQQLDIAINSFLDALHRTPCDLLVVTNETGWGIVPENALAREFRDIAGGINRRVASIAEHVYLCVCGIPVVVK